MAQTASVTAQKFAQFLTADDAGVNSAIGELSNAAGLTVATIPPAHIFSQNTPVLIAERSLAVKYPVIHVYVDRVRNLLTEKFRSFSGKVRTVAEVRVSQDRIEGLEDQTATLCRSGDASVGCKSRWLGSRRLLYGRL